MQIFYTIGKKNCNKIFFINKFYKIYLYMLTLNIDIFTFLQ